MAIRLVVAGRDAHRRKMIVGKRLLRAVTRNTQLRWGDMV